MNHRTLWIVCLLLALAACGGETAVSPTNTPSPTATVEEAATVTGTAVRILHDPIVTINNIPLAPTQEPWRLFESPEYGIHLSQWWRVKDLLPRDLALVNEMGFGWVKQEFPWREIEGAAKGEYDWYRPDQIVARTEEANLKLLVRLNSQPLWSVEEYIEEGRVTASQPPADYQDFGDFCHALAERFTGRIAAYQVWNEPNLSREWGELSPNPAEYTELLRVCYEGIKTADPDAIVISAGLAPTGTQPPIAMPDDAFLQGMYDAGADAYFDVLGLNSPGYKAPPNTSPEDGANRDLGWGGHRWNVFRHVEDMRAIMVANGDAHKQVAILEMGWILQQEYHADYQWYGITEEQQAAYLVQAYQYAQQNWQPWIGLMTTVYFADPAWTPEENEQYWWSIVLPDGSQRAAYEALAEMGKNN